MRFAVSGWIFHHDPAKVLGRVVDLAHSLGYDGLEIPTLDARLELRRIREGLGNPPRMIPIWVGGGSPSRDLSNPSERIQRAGVAYLRRLVDLCAGSGGELVAGPLYGAVGRVRYLSPARRDAALSRVARHLSLVARYAASRSVRIALEPLNRYDTSLVNTVAQGIELLERIGEPNVGLALDTFHMNIEERSVGKALREAGRQLFYLQACENDRGAVGSGHVPWTEWRDALRSISYDGWVGVESFISSPPGFAEAMRMWRPVAASPQELAGASLSFLQGLFP